MWCKRKRDMRIIKETWKRKRIQYCLRAFEGTQIKNRTVTIQNLVRFFLTVWMRTIFIKDSMKSYIFLTMRFYRMFDVRLLRESSKIMLWSVFVHKMMHHPRFMPFSFFFLFSLFFHLLYLYKNVYPTYWCVFRNKIKDS
jgi:hypothetical protein